MGVFGMFDGFPGIIGAFFIAGYSGKLLKLKSETKDQNVSQILLADGFSSLDFYFYFFAISAMVVGVAITLISIFWRARQSRRNDCVRQEINMTMSTEQISQMLASFNSVADSNKQLAGVAFAPSAPDPPPSEARNYSSSTSFSPQLRAFGDDSAEDSEQSSDDAAYSSELP